MKIVTLMHDDSPTNPATFDGAWKLYSFNRRHHSHADPETFFPNGKPTIGFRRKLDTGLAFVLSYFEHGACQWSRQGTGPQCQWDNVKVAGVLVWEHTPKEMGAKSKEARAKDADSFLETYTSWCNGDVYGYAVSEVVTLPCGHTERRDLDSCFGFYGNDLTYFASEIKAALAGDTEIQFEGDAKEMSGYLNLGGGK